MVFTDPPYGVAIGDKNKTLQSVQKAGRIEENLANDTLAPDALYQVLKPVKTARRTPPTSSALRRAGTSA